MSIKKVETKITTYQLTDNFFVEAQETISGGEEVINLWLYHKRYGIKLYMSGIKKCYLPADCFEPTLVDLVERQSREHMRYYYEKHMDYNPSIEAEIEAYCGKN